MSGARASRADYRRARRRSPAPIAPTHIWFAVTGDSSMELHLCTCTSHSRKVDPGAVRGSRARAHRERHHDCSIDVCLPSLDLSQRDAAHLTGERRFARPHNKSVSSPSRSSVTRPITHAVLASPSFFPHPSPSLVRFGRRPAEPGPPLYWEPLMRPMWMWFWWTALVKVPLPTRSAQG
jgi:hypothetical protein